METTTQEIVRVATVNGVRTFIYYTVEVPAIPEFTLDYSSMKGAKR